MIVVGAFARVVLEEAAAVRVRLDALPGVSTFDLGDPAKVGILIEEADVDRAHDKLTGAVRGVEGVLGVWPVSLHDGAEEEEKPWRAESGPAR